MAVRDDSESTRRRVSAALPVGAAFLAGIGIGWLAFSGPLATDRGSSELQRGLAVETLEKLTARLDDISRRLVQTAAAPAPEGSPLGGPHPTAGDAPRWAQELERRLDELTLAVRTMAESVPDRTARIVAGVEMNVPVEVSRLRRLGDRAIRLLDKSILRAREKLDEGEEGLYVGHRNRAVEARDALDRVQSVEQLEAWYDTHAGRVALPLALSPDDLRQRR